MIVYFVISSRMYVHLVAVDAGPGTSEPGSVRVLFSCVFNRASICFSQPALLPIEPLMRLMATLCMTGTERCVRRMLFKWAARASYGTLCKRPCHVQIIPSFPLYTSAASIRPVRVPLVCLLT